MVRCVLSQLKPSELYILSFDFKAKNIELLRLYPILSDTLTVKLLASTFHSFEAGITNAISRHLI